MEYWLKNSLEYWENGYNELQLKIMYLLDTYKLWSEDGTFTWPNGEMWHRING